MALGKRLSAVVVAQDNEATIQQVLDCLVRVADEIIVVDGGSRDATVDISRSCPKVRLYHREFDGNIAVQKNFGCDQAHGDWILILDTDELLCGNAITRIPRLIRGTLCRWFKFERHWIVEHEGELCRLQSPLHHPDWQLRLFRNCPTFRYDPNGSPIHHHFPKRGRGWGRRLFDMNIQHYDLMLNDRATREAKVERYTRIDPASKDTNAMYLWEDGDSELVPVECEMQPLRPFSSAAGDPPRPSPVPSRARTALETGPTR